MNDQLSVIAPLSRSQRRRAARKASKAKSSGSSPSNQIPIGIGDLPTIVSKMTTPRQTLPTNANILGSFPYAFLPRRQYQAVDLSTVNVSTLSPQQVIDLLSDADPDVSLAMWNFLLLVCGNWTVDVRTPEDDEDPDGKDAINQILSNVNEKWGGFQNLLYQFTMAVLLEGACAGETIPSDDLKDVHDIVSVTPWTIYFQRDANQDLIVYQWQPMLANGMINDYEQPPTIANVANGTYGAAGFRLMNTETFRYVPFLPMVDDPYGRMPFASVFQVIVFDNQLLQDLRRWAHVNAWGRIDVSIIQDMVQKLVPPAIQANKKELIQFINQYTADVAKAYNNIGPDDSFIHLDNVKVGTVDSSGKTFQVDQLIQAVERKKFRALRMLPILMGSNEGTTESHGTVQWDIMARGVEAIQVCVASLANTLLTVGLRLRGSASHAVLKFEQVRATDRMMDAQAQAVEIKNAAAMRDEGWITQDEASIKITNSPAVGPAPNPDAYVAVDMPVAGNPLPVPASTPADTVQDSSSNGKSSAKDSTKDATTKSDAPDADSADKADAKPAQSAKDSKTKGTTKTLLSDAERDAIQLAMTRMILRGTLDRSAKKPAYKGPSSARNAATIALGHKLAKRFRSISVSEKTIGHILETHTSRMFARSKRIAPDLADGIKELIAIREGEPTNLSPEQRAALKANVASMLADDIPDYDEDGYNDLYDGDISAYNLGGQEGLQAVGLSGTFDITRAETLAMISASCRIALSQIAGTTRDQLATTIVNTMEDDGDTTDIANAITSRLDEMANGRAMSIAQNEVNNNYWQATHDTWMNNGVPMKSWVTNGDPDPGARDGTPCRDNSYASPILMTDTFPSGDDAPTAHFGCECDLAPSGDPSDDAQAEPWTGA